MSLYKIKHLLDAFTSIEKITKNASMNNPSEVQNYTKLETELIARLVDEGIPYEVKTGKIVVDINGYANSYNINDIYPYVSPDVQYKLMFRNMQGNMPQNEYLLQQNNEYDNISEYTKSYQGSSYNEDASERVINTEEVTHKDDIESNDYIETYVSENKAPEESVTTPEQESLITDDMIKEAIGKKEPAENTEDLSDIAAVSEKNEAGSSNSGSIIEIPLEEKEEYTELSTTILTAEQLDRPQFPPDIKAISKFDMTYEKATLIIRDKITGETSKLLAVSFPMDEGSGYVITHIATKDSAKTLMGQTTETPYRDTYIVTRMNHGSPFSCDYSIKNSERYEIIKDSIKKGGKGGRLSIYDNDLTVYVYPIGTKNAEDGNAPIAYYVWSEGMYFCSSTKENPAIFSYKGKKYNIKTVWKEDTAYINISDL